MAIKSLLADFGGTNGKIFLGGSVALNLLGDVSSGGGIPADWKSKMKDFLTCKKGESFKLAGQDVIRDGFYVKVKGITFTETEHGTKGPAYWELGEKVSSIPKTELAAKLRKIIAKPTTAENDKWVVNLAAAMFLSEVARNPRSFMINLMLLDLIEGGVKYGSKQNKELDFGKLLKFDAQKSGKTATYTYEKEKVKVGVDGKAGTVRGGKLPMSQLDAMKQFEEAAGKSVNYDGTFGEIAKQSGLNLKAPDAPNTAYHFPNALLEKECTVLLRWLTARFIKNPPKLQTGTISRTVTANAWGKTTTSTLQEPTYAPVTITGLREHKQDPSWKAATAMDTKDAAGALIKAVRENIALRQVKEENMLA